MTTEELQLRLEQLREEMLPLPGDGNTPERHRRLFAVAREDVSLAKLAEAHWDAQAILAEAARVAEPHALYGVWASEVPGQEVDLIPSAGGFRLRGTKPFCSGALLVDRALVTVGRPSRLVEVDVRRYRDSVRCDLSGWSTDAFQLTGTGSVTFESTPLSADALRGDPGWYTARAGFWHGACGPAACWAGGTAGLVDFAIASRRQDAHTLAHLGAIQAELWGLKAVLDTAGREIDSAPAEVTAAQARALTVRHLVERACTDILHRFARAFGPHPLAMVPATARRYHEVDLFLRQSHAERDLEALGSIFRAK